MSTIVEADDIDWALLGKTRPLNFDDLRNLSSADLDPYTVQVAQTLCEHFTLSPLGIRNVSSAFTPLTEGKFHRGTFDIGFGTYHSINTIIKSDLGFTLIAIIGSLAEYYDEDFIVDFLSLLAKRLEVPQALVPVESQWRRLVSVLYGVLAASDFGHVISSFERRCPAVTEEPKAEAVLDALHQMSNLARHRGRSVQCIAGADTVWIASAASWLFDLKYLIKTEVQNFMVKGPDVDQLQDAEITIVASGSSIKAIDASQLERDHSPSATSTRKGIPSGRVHFNDIFRPCFRDAFTDLDRNTVAKYLRSASQILTDTLESRGINPRNVFLSQTSDKPGSPSHDLVKTLVAWFPEIHVIMDRAKQPKRKLDLVECRQLFDEQVAQFQQQCICSTCRGEPASASSEICKLFLVEFIAVLGLNIARTVVTPNLFPKREGVVAFYRNHHARRTVRPPSDPSSPSEKLINTIIDNLPTPIEMIKTGFLLFTNSDVSVQPDLMGMTHAGITIFVNGQKEMNDWTKGKVSYSPSVSVVPGSMSLYGHEGLIEIWQQVPGAGGLSLDEAFAELNRDPGDVQQIMRWRGHEILVSVVKKGREAATRAAEEGWWFTMN